VEEVVYKVNFDFESKLAGKTKKFPGAAWFDHIFFFINTNRLAKLNSGYKFPKEYLSYIEKKGVITTSLSTERPLDWWSVDTNIERNKLFNSKIEMTLLGLDKKWIPINTKIGLESLPKFSKKVVVREEWGFSGKGTYFLDSEEKFDKKGKFVISEFVEKEKDYGVTFLLDEDKYFVIESYIDQFGQFVGGEILNNSLFEKQVGKENIETLLNIKNELVRLGAKKFVQIDCFSYDKGFHPFVEVNYRRTMGQMISSLKRITQKDFVMWKIFKLKTRPSFNDLTVDLEKICSDIIITSPVDKFVSVCLPMNDVVQFNDTKKELEKFFSEL
jgi:hypothetical protein